MGYQEVEPLPKTTNILRHFCFYSAGLYGNIVENKLWTKSLHRDVKYWKNNSAISSHLEAVRMHQNYHII